MLNCRWKPSLGVWGTDRQVRTSQTLRPAGQVGRPTGSVSSDTQQVATLLRLDRSQIVERGNYWVCTTKRVEGAVGAAEVRIWTSGGDRRSLLTQQQQQQHIAGVTTKSATVIANKLRSLVLPRTTIPSRIKQMSDYPEIKNEECWPEWSEKCLSVAGQHGCEIVLL